MVRQWRIHRGAMGPLAPYGVEIIFFIVVFSQKLNHYTLIGLPCSKPIKPLSVAINIHNYCFLNATFSLLFVGVAEVATENVKHINRPLNR